MIKTYNKIVRTKTPRNISQDSREPKVREIKRFDDEIVIRFKEKLLEEVHELIEATDDASILTEAADVVQVVRDYIRSIGNYHPVDLEVVRNSKEIRKGTFLTENLSAVFLEEVDDKK